jgi:hypothetical protein
LLKQRLKQFKEQEIIIREREQIKIHTMSNKVIYAIYNDDDILMDAVKTRAAHHHEEVLLHFRFTVWIKQWVLHQQISYLHFIRLCWYFILLQMMNYIMIQDWPDIGGNLVLY